MHKILSFLLLINFFNLSSMRIKNASTKITFENQAKSIGHWIKLCIINPSHPFAQTKTYLYKNNNFIEKGNLLSLNKKEIESIFKGNSILCTNYELVKTKNNGTTFKQINVLIVGINTRKALDLFYTKNAVTINYPIQLQSKL